MSREHEQHRRGPGPGVRLQEFLMLAGHSSAGHAMAIMVESGLTMPQIVTLNILELGGTHTVSAIADRLRLSRAATSHLVDQLTRRGYVARSEDASDRRQKKVSVTAKGSRLASRLLASRREDFERAIARLTPGLRGEFNRVLARVVAQLKAAACGGRGHGGAR